MPYGFNADRSKYDISRESLGFLVINGTHQASAGSGEVSFNYSVSSITENNFDEYMVVCIEQKDVGSDNWSNDLGHTTNKMYCYPHAEILPSGQFYIVLHHGLGSTDAGTMSFRILLLKVA